MVTALPFLGLSVQKHGAGILNNPSETEFYQISHVMATEDETNRQILPEGH